MAGFELVSKYEPTGDQPAAISELVSRLRKGYSEQTLLGVTGSGKTFTMANVIEQVGQPTLVLAHNKTLAAQLYSEFREYFPNNSVHYFVSYFDYYQPEAYIASSDTYIEKDSTINDEIERLRHAATEALINRRDVIIVASVSCIYGIGSPSCYEFMALKLKVGDRGLSDFILKLTGMQYSRNDVALETGNFRVKGDIVDVFPASGNHVYRVEFAFDEIEAIKIIDPLNSTTLEVLQDVTIFPNSHYVTPKDRMEKAIELIKVEFEERLAYFVREEKVLEAERLRQRLKYDLEMLQETGFVKGIENYSRHLDGRSVGEPPSTLLDYFPPDYLTLIDESHMTLPQVRGMYNGDRARKQNLVDYGFRLPSALDNRPLQFEEFLARKGKTIYISATPSEYELSRSPKPTEQVIRPTGLLDPVVEVRKTEGQIDDLVSEISERIARKERVLVTTLTKKMAEDLSEHLSEMKFKTAYLHSDIDTLERGDILRDLRNGVYDVLIGINLLREGLDLPEVSLVVILDADKEGFLRSRQALIQTIGRAARNEEGRVIMYADKITDSMSAAIEETERRRAIQEEYNAKNGITPTSVSKEVSLGLRAIIPEKEKGPLIDVKSVPIEERVSLIRELESQMKLASANLEFERAIELRNAIEELKKG